MVTTEADFRTVDTPVAVRADEASVVEFRSLLLRGPDNGETIALVASLGAVVVTDGFRLTAADDDEVPPVAAELAHILPERTA